MATSSRNISNRIIILESGVDVNGSAATADMTSDAIPFDINKPWSLNVWFDSAFSVTGSDPTITIEVSNDFDGDADSFTPLTDATDIDLPYYFDGLDSTFLWMRVVYTANGATAGTKNFDLIQWEQYG